MVCRLILLWLAVFFVSCSASKDISFEVPVFGKQYRVNTTVLNDSYVYGHAWNLLTCDSLLIVVDMGQEDIIHIFNRNTGVFLKSAGKKGNGPGELASPGSVALDKAKGILYVNDDERKVVFRYCLKNIVNDLASYLVEIKLDDEVPNVSRICCLRDSLFIAEGKKDRLLIFTPSGIKQTYNEFNATDKFKTPQEWSRFLQQCSKNSVSPDGRKYATATSLGAILEIFSIADNRIKLTNTGYFIEPVFDLKGTSVIPNEHTIGGFAFMSTTDKYIYATIFGTVNPVKMPHVIWKFDWNGNPVASYETNSEIECFAVDEATETVYASVYKDGEQVLAKIDLKDATGIQKD